MPWTSAQAASVRRRADQCGKIPVRTPPDGGGEHVEGFPGGLAGRRVWVQAGTGLADYHRVQVRAGQCGVPNSGAGRRSA
jgi:hypothetical protein